MRSPWVWFDNFKTIFSVEQFWIALKNTIVINFFKIILGFPAPIILAIMINEIRSKKVKGPIQTILYLPHFLSWVVIAGLIFSLLEDGGILSLLGIDGVKILSNGNSALALVIFRYLERSRWGSIIYLAPINGINPRMKQPIDGANSLQKISTLLCRE